MPSPDRPEPAAAGPTLAADCSSCFGLCCAALPFTASSDFPVDKSAGDPCHHLRDDFRCDIHARLREEGYRGCTVFDCFGAGQQVSQVTYRGRSWREDPETAQSMYAVFAVMRQLHEMLLHLGQAVALTGELRSEAVDGLPPGPGTRTLGAELAAARDHIHLLVDSGPQVVLAVDVDALRGRVAPLLVRTSAEVRAREPGSDLSARFGAAADLVGADLRGANLCGADLRGALLIAADLRDADLARVDLLGADLRDADVRGTDLASCIFLSQPQLNATRGDARTRIPAALTRPGHWA